MYHAHDGWFFGRNDDGSVRIVKHDRADDRASVVAETTVPADMWASIVASVSAGDEIDLRFYSARKFHESTGMVDLVALDPTEYDGVRPLEVCE